MRSFIIDAFGKSEQLLKSSVLLNFAESFCDIATGWSGDDVVWQYRTHSLHQSAGPSGGAEIDGPFL